MGKERRPDGRAEVDSNPRHGMRIVLIFPKDKRPGQTDNADQPESGCDSYAGDRPKIGNDLRYPARPILAHPEVGGPPLDLLTEPATRSNRAAA